MGTGLGPESYAIIEQGRIGQILSSKPTDRRAIIEEAAGITKFKTRSGWPKRAWKTPSMNLARVNDIFDEVTRQMNSLKRQASKAERYAKLREEMRAKLRVVLASKFAQLDQESAALDAQLDAVWPKKCAAGRSRAADGSRARRAHPARLRHRNASSRENRERLNQIEAGDPIAPLAQRRAQRGALRRTGAALRWHREAELAAAQQRLAALAAELEANRQILDSAAADLAAAQQEWQKASRKPRPRQRAGGGGESAGTASRARSCRRWPRRPHLRNQHHPGRRAHRGLDREPSACTTEIATANPQVEAFGGQRGQLGLEFETVSQRVAGLAAEIAADPPEAGGEARREETEAKRHLDTLRAEYATALGKKGSLEAVIAEHGYSTESVRRLFQSGAMKGGMAPAGVLADFLEVEPRYEHVVEDFLRDELNYVVVKSWDAADEGLRLLRTDVDGRATFLVHPEDSQAKFSFLVMRRASRSRPSDTHRPAEELHSRAQRLRQVAGSNPAQAAATATSFPTRARPRSGAGKSRRVLPLAIRRMLPQRHRHRRQAAQPKARSP